ncbi:MAG: polysaccharide deacetylase family protein [Saprospiraceae bacterium]|nr:polysaccharide deacetylase family protein [Saprospiraceae bacterium]
MAGYRSSVISRINRVSTKIPLHTLIQLSGQNVVLPVYHLASDEDVPHIKHLYTIKNLSAFNRDLDFLLRNFEPIDLSTLIDHVEQRRTLKKPSFFLSFDDGLQEFYTVIAPILLARGIPATNFLNSSFIDNKELFFRYKVSLIIDRLQKETNIKSLKAIYEILRIKDIPVKNLISALLKLRYSDFEKTDQIAKILQVDFKQFLNKKKPYLTTQQIRDLINQGFTFGAHSIDHPRYSDEPLSEQIRQTEVSTNLICEKFNLNHRIFAFPFTDYQVSKTYFDHFFHNKKLLDLSFGSAGLKRDIYPHQLQRIPMEMGKMTANQIIHGEYLYFLLKGMLGKNRIERI